MAKNWSSVGLPIELINEIDLISRAEDRSKHAIVRRAIHLYRESEQAPDMEGTKARK